MKCFDCGRELTAVPQPGWLNSDQWDAIKNGDYFAECDDALHENGNCYFRETAGLETLKRISPKQRKDAS